MKLKVELISVCRGCILARTTQSAEQTQKRTFFTFGGSAPKFVSKLYRTDSLNTVQKWRFLHTSSYGLRQQVEFKFPQVDVPEPLFKGMDTDFPCATQK